MSSFLDPLFSRRALWVIKDKQIGILGLAFKANTDDIRFAPAIEIIRRLLAEGARIRAYDPEAMEKTRQIFPAVQFTENPYEAARDADALLIVTEWEQFRSLDWNRVRELMDRPLLLDGRNLLDPEAIKAAGFEYHSVGRPDTSPPLT